VPIKLTTASVRSRQAERLKLSVEKEAAVGYGIASLGNKRQKR
jgi:hypothetical protein